MDIGPSRLFRSTFVFMSACCGATALLAIFAHCSHGVEFINPQHYLNPATGLYDVFYTPPHLLRPSSSLMAKVGGGDASAVPPGTTVGGSSGVVVAPNWVLTARHIRPIPPGETEPDFLNLPVWIDGVQYRVAEQKIAPTADLALLRIIVPDWDSNPANDVSPSLPYVSIDPNITTMAGTMISQGGFGNKTIRSSATGAPTGGSHIAHGILSWGRNSLTSPPPSTYYSAPPVETVPFQVFGTGNDSGGGWFVRDGWNWRLVGITATATAATTTISTANYDWIDLNIGGLPTLQHTAKPTATVQWTGPSNGNWHTASNWQDAATHLPRVPGLNATNYDTVSIATAGVGPAISTSASTRDLFVGAAGTSAELNVNAGASLTATTIFAGADTGESGLIWLSGGSITSDTQYLGFRGSFGGLVQSGGSNTSSDIYIGRETTSGAGFYQLMGASSDGSKPTLNARGIEIGGSTGSQGFVFLTGGAGPYAQVQATEQIIVGRKGAGSVSQQFGTVNAGKTLVLGHDPTGSGTYSLSGGTLQADETQVGALGSATFSQSSGVHTTRSLTIGAGDAYTITGGHLSAKQIANGGALNNQGGTILTNKVSGPINFASAAGTMRGEGLVDLTDASILNNASAQLIVDDDSLVLLPSANTFGSTTILGSLNPHTVGSTLHIADGGFRGAGEIPDHVTVTDGGYVGSRGANDYLHLRKGISVTSTTSAPITAALSTAASSEAILLYPNGAHLGLETAAGTTLRARGNFVLMDSGSKADINGVLEIGGDLGSPAIGHLTVLSAYVDTSTRFSLNSTATLNLNIDRNTSAPGQPIVSDTVYVGLGNASLDGGLHLAELAGFQPKPKEEVILLSTDLGRLSGTFDYVTVDDGDAATNNIQVITTSGGWAAYAIRYVSSQYVSARVSLPADFNLDDVVNSADLAIWSTNFGLGDATWEMGDANGDSWVNGNDFLVYQINSGRSWPAPLLAVPEPSSMLLLCYTAAAAISLTRRRSLYW